MTENKRFEAHIHCGDGGEYYHDGVMRVEKYLPVKKEKTTLDKWM